MHSDATGVQQLTNDAGYQPKVSRDGQKIVYVRMFRSVSRPGDYTRIWVVNADGSDQHEVFVAPPSPPFQQTLDTISDDSPGVVTRRDRDVFIRHPVSTVAAGVLVMNADGTGLTGASP